MSFNLRFPKDSGFTKTEIRFYSDQPELTELYPLTGQGPMRLFVTDTNIAELEPLKKFAGLFTKESERVFSARNGRDILLCLAPGEAYKDIDHVLAIVKVALDHNFDRGAIFVAIGGGVISDMTAFAASIFKRGVAVEFVPTTLLSMVDAAIGGKTGCDFESYKNMIGAFYPAKLLHVFPKFVQSLPQREYVSGLGEAVKTAFLFSPGMTELLKTQKDLVLKRDEAILEKVIAECATAKAKIVHKDFKEKGERAFLNLGHTFGHALESVAGLGTITHGEAVAWGMGRAIDLSLSKGLCTEQFAKEAKDILSGYGYDMKSIPSVLTQNGTDADLLAQKILDAMKKDKKNKAQGSLRVILQKDIGKNLIQEVSEQEVLQVLK